MFTEIQTCYFPMQDAQNYKGIWFLPGNEEKAVSGILDYSSTEGIELDLIGALSDQRGLKPEQDFILGVTSNGKKITLYKCYNTHSAFNTSGFESSRYDALYMFVGHHFKSEDELAFCELRASLSDFGVWLGIYGFNKVDSNFNTKEFSLEYKQPADILFSITPEFEGKFEFSSNVPLSKKISEASIRQNSEISIRPVEGEKNFRQLMDCFWGFMTFAYFESPLIEELSLGVKRKGNHEEDLKYVNLFFQARSNSSSRPNKKSRRFFLLTYDNIKVDFEKIIRKWYEIGEKAGPSIYALIESYSEREQPVEYKFLNLAHAVETFHRRTMDSKEMTSEAYAEKLQKIVDAVDPEFQTWIKEKLQFSNEVNLHKRLEELIQKMPSEIKPVLLKPSEKEFIKVFKKTRNYYTHYSTSLAKGALKDADLFTFSERIKIFLTCIILKELEFSDEQIVEIIFKKGVMLFNHIIPYKEVEGYLNQKRTVNIKS